MTHSLMSSDLSVQAIRRALTTERLGHTIHFLEHTSSTNAEALALAQEGAADGTVVLADHQTAGRGRLGRIWHSPPGNNLYCSILLSPRSSAGPQDNALTWIPLSTGVAVARTLRRASGLAVTLKWPNDILVNEKKIGGVLCERTGSLQNSDSLIVVGIGLNVNLPSEAFPEEIRPAATSLAAEAGRTFDRSALLAALLLELERCWLQLFSAGPGEATAAYTEFCSTIGHRVRVTVAGDTTVEGRAMQIGPDGSLVIMPDASDTTSGATTPLTVRAGDVIHLRNTSRP